MKRLRSRDGSSNDESDESNSGESSDDDDDDDLCSTGSQDGERQSEGQAMKRLHSRDGSFNDESDESNSGESSDDDDDDDLCSTGSQDGERQSEGQGLPAAFLPIRNDAVDQPSREQPQLVSASLTKHSASTFSPLHENHWASPEKNLLPVANMDHYRDSMLLDRLKGNDGEVRYVSYEWASPEHPDLYDGSSTVFYSKLFPLLVMATDNGTAAKPALEEFVGAIEAARDGQMSHVRLSIRVPQMVLTPEVDVRSKEAGDVVVAPFTTERGELIVDGAKYRRQTDPATLLCSTELLVQLQRDDDRPELQVSVKYDEAKRATLTLSEASNGDDGDAGCPMVIETWHEGSNWQGDNAARFSSGVRSLLFLPEWDETQLTNARIEHAKTYVGPVLPALIAQGVNPKDADLRISLLVRQIGSKMVHDIPNEGTPQTWVWNEASLWHMNDAAVRTAVKTAATELSEQAARISSFTIYDSALKRAQKLYPCVHVRKGGKKVEEEAEEEEEEEAEEEAEEEEGSGSFVEEEVDEEDTIAVPVDDEEKEEAADEEKKLNALKEHVALRLKSRHLTSSLANNPRILASTLSSIEPWISECGFAESICTTRAVAFQNGMQDLEPPYDFHQPTPLDRVKSRRPYALEVPYQQMTPEKLAELETWTIDERFVKLFRDVYVARREADKDAVMLLGRPAVLSECNLRLHLGPFLKEDQSFGEGCGKDAHKAMIKACFADDLVDDSLDAGILSLTKAPGKAYSCFDGIEHRHLLWIDETANNTKEGSAGKVQQVQKMNPGMVLKLLPAGANTTFSYRVEHGREKKVPIKLVMALTTNRLVSPGTGFTRKTEVSPYPVMYRSYPEEVEQLTKRGHKAELAAGGDSFEKLLKQCPGRTMSYLVHRAIEISKDEKAAYPPTKTHREMYELIFSLEANHMEAVEAAQGLRDFLDDVLEPCPPPKGAAAAVSQLSIAESFRVPDPTADEDEREKRNLHQALGRSGVAQPRCFCANRTKPPHACHFQMAELATLLKDQARLVHDFYVRKTGQTGALAIAVQRQLRLVEGPVAKRSGYNRNSIFGWKLKQRSAATAASEASMPGAHLQNRWSQRSACAA